jgi:hypothetical protein
MGTPLAIAVQLLPTPDATHGRKQTRTGPLLPGAVESLLKTPTAQLAVNGGSQHPDKRRAGGHGPTLADQVEHSLLPTPRATDGTKGGPNQRGSSGDLMLPSAVMDLLPTPNATDSQGGPRALPERRTSRGKDHGPRLRDIAPTLLPTPSAADGDGGHLHRGGERAAEMLLPGVAKAVAEGRLLPTPTAMDSHGARNATAGRTQVKPQANNDGRTLSGVFWTGEPTSPRSAAGSPSSGGPRPRQLRLDEADCPG